ncbi:MAG: phenylalanine--tRNA ligase subunit alpha [Candidatus Omnitrophica bacterium]|nr:phenylalanine--tRNA ligase subunit alpha [Candidatus Omnitrophota bacterium]
MSRIDEIKAAFEAEISSCKRLEGLEEMKVRYLGRKGELTSVLRSLSELPEDERRKAGMEANKLKELMNSGIEEARTRLEMKSRGEKASEMDVTLPGFGPPRGGLHPITKTMGRISEIFVSLGFRIAEGPEVETEFYNFEALNIPLDHPSRDGFDTFYIKGKTLLRSHTSNVQIHIMQKQKPPFQVLMPGRVYRPDAVDATHSFMFHQVEGLMVDTDISFADLKGALTLFCRSMFGEDTRMRFRPSFFPFTEPSAEVDISCFICKGKGCRVCKMSGWLEIMGAGLVDPKVFEAVGYDPGKYTGFAFGMGVERIAMLLYGINDIRLFYENDVRFLRQFI